MEGKIWVIDSQRANGKGEVKSKKKEVCTLYFGGKSRVYIFQKFISIQINQSGVISVFLL
jgi:hypothetical protein